MICIFSSARDESTNDVLRWTRHLGPDFQVQRVNDDEGDRIGMLRVTADSIVFAIEGVELDASELTTVWYRKGQHWLCDLFRAPPLASEPGLSRHLEFRMRMEEARLSEYVHGFIQRGSWCLGSADRGDLNKLVVLAAAASVGLRVPRFLISSSVRALAGEVGSVPSVTKAIADGLYLFDDTAGSRGFYSYTERVRREDLADLPGIISPSLVQEEIKKRFDVRVFYLEGRSRAMAIFSQNDERTQVDFRKYNDARPNRTVPYLLPQEIEARLEELFQALDLKTGSADLVVDREGEHVFLEINPVGQFGMVSEPCNYYLERDIARTLIAHE